MSQPITTERVRGGFAGPQTWAPLPAAPAAVPARRRQLLKLLLRGAVVVVALATGSLFALCPALLLPVALLLPAVFPLLLVVLLCLITAELPARSPARRRDTN
jgi:hypothetical protein